MAYDFLRFLCAACVSLHEFEHYCVFTTMHINSFSPLSVFGSNAIHHNHEVDMVAINKYNKESNEKTHKELPIVIIFS